ncbi:MAG: glutaredoxin domain-containing protein [Acidimicrobiia bacterium]|nr:glutaredoxin domain-containing protein [Acidimicrobiia bacterium]
MTEHEVADPATETPGGPSETSRIDLYWRPGCGFCSSLRRGLDKAGIDRREHDIWADPDAAAVVRRVARGNETVPTVVIGDIGMVNPSAKQVVAVLREHAPQLLPQEDENDPSTAEGASSVGAFRRLTERIRGT